jgi:hypothetical protein
LINNINQLFWLRIFYSGNKKAFLEEKGLKCSLYGLVEQDSYYLFFLAALLLFLLGFLASAGVL